MLQYGVGSGEWVNGGEAWAMGGEGIEWELGMRWELSSC